jgi:hypothetical protein
MSVLNSSKALCEKIISGTDISISDINTLLFTDGFTLDGIISQDDFNRLLSSFDFNNGGTVTIDDFEYLVNHVSDLSVMFRLSHIGINLSTKMSLINNLTLTELSVLDTIVRLIIYCVLFIVAKDCASFRTWASTKTTDGNSTNLDILFLILSDMVDYIKASRDIKDKINTALKYFKNNCGCSCISVSNNDTTLNTLNVNIRSDIVGLNKETVQASRAFNKH